MKTLRALGRAARAVWHVVRGLWIIRTEFGRLTPAQTDLVVREWSRGLLRILGVGLSVRGEVPTGGPLLQVANHTSWLDIVVMNAARPSRFVSKADARHWPLLGSLITGAGTLYIEREKRRDAMRVVHHVAERLRAGDVIAVLLPFHANLFQAAVSALAPVLPVGLAFMDAATGRPHPAPVFVGDTTLVASIWNVLSADGLQAVVHYGVPEEALGRDRRTWAQQARDEVERLRRTDPL